jgi:superfamily II DNA helicase RecQ
MRVKGRGAIKKKVMRVMSRLKASITEDQKEVMYCRSKQGCEGLARKLKYDFYHAKMKRGDEARRERFRR